MGRWTPFTPRTRSDPATTRRQLCPVPPQQQQPWERGLTRSAEGDGREALALAQTQTQPVVRPLLGDGPRKVTELRGVHRGWVTCVGGAVGAATGRCEWENHSGWANLGCCPPAIGTRPLHMCCALLPITLSVDALDALELLVCPLLSSRSELIKFSKHQGHWLRRCASGLDATVRRILHGPPVALIHHSTGQALTQLVCFLV